jgi:thioredoxin 1
MKCTIEGSDINFEQEVLNSDVPVLVDFWAPWCSSCRLVESTVERIALEYLGQIKVVKINTDDYEEIADQYGIRSIPAFGIFINGRAVESFIGAVPKNIFGNRIKPFIHAIN